MVEELPEVTITATDATAGESGPDTGQYTVTRTGGTTADLTVYYSVGGTATSYDMNVDFTGLPNYDPWMGPGYVDIPAQTASVPITITPIDDAETEDPETVVLTLTADPYWMSVYELGTPASATVTIEDNDPLPVVTIVATDSDASEEGPDPGVFTVTRTGNLSNPLRVYYSVGGTATSYEMDVDFTGLPNYDPWMGPGWVDIPAQTASVPITITPVDDAWTEGAETVVVTLDGVRRLLDRLADAVGHGDDQRQRRNQSSTHVGERNGGGDGGHDLYVLGDGLSVQ